MKIEIDAEVAAAMLAVCDETTRLGSDNIVLIRRYTDLLIAPALQKALEGVDVQTPAAPQFDLFGED